MNEGMRVIAHSADGTETDVTEGVQALYDHCVCSMDWGSGFLSVEDAEGIIRVAQACGFLMPDDAAAQFEEYARQYSGQGPNSSNVICAECGEGVVYSYDWTRVRQQPVMVNGSRYADIYVSGNEAATATMPERSGWRHKDHDPGHLVRLWR